MAKAKETKTIATGSLRRKAQWGAQNPQDKIVPLRGNIQTRLKKLKEEDWDGAIFAEAALHRLEIKNEIIEPLDQVMTCSRWRYKRCKLVMQTARLIIGS